MLESWVFWSLLAAAMQAIRTAGQKYLTAEISPLGATLVRYLFGLPFVATYLIWLLVDRDGPLPEPNVLFLVYGVAAGFSQIVATVLLIRLFTLRNFVVGSCYVRTEILITALIGMTLFGEHVAVQGWLAMLACVSGLVLITLANSGKLSDLLSTSSLYGLGAGVAFSLTSLMIRDASLSFKMNDAVFTAALTLAYMIVVQTLISLFMLAIVNAAEYRTIMRRWRASLFVGATSVVGSVGWFTAFTLEKAAYVKTLGQFEVLLSMVISIFFFRERPIKREVWGMIILVCGIIMLLLSH